MEPGIDVGGLRARGRILSAVRRWFDHHGYVEVPTPAIVPSAAMEPHLHPIPAGGGALRTSPEFALKRVVAAGLPRVYEIGPCFRDRERGSWHGVEFTLLEWYRAGAEPADLMDEVEQLVCVACAAVGRPAPASRHAAEPTVAGRWRRISVRDLVRETTGLDLAVASADELTELAGAPDAGWDEAFTRIWVDRVEPALKLPTIVDRWPASMAALARVVDDPVWPTASRFEVYLGGVELANAFHELGDATEQRRRFATANAERAGIGEPPHPVDEAFVDAVGRLPRCAGIALGIDRFVAAIQGWDGIARGRVPADV